MPKGRDPVQVGAYPSVMIADLVKGRLEAEGIMAFLADENAGTSFAGLETALGGIRVFVAPEDAERAVDVIAGLSHPLGTAEVPADLDAPAGDDEYATAEEEATPTRERAADRFLLLVVLGLLAIVAIGFLVDRIMDSVKPDEPEVERDGRRRMPAPYR